MGTLNATDRPEGVGSGFVGRHRCPRLIGEISDVLDRPRLHKQIGAECACEFVEMISALPNQVTDLSEIAVARRDVDDDIWLCQRENTMLLGSLQVTMTSSAGTNSSHQRLRPLRLRNGSRRDVNFAGTSRLRTRLDSKRAYVDRSTNCLDRGVFGGRTWTQEYVIAGHGLYAHLALPFFCQGEGRGFKSRLPLGWNPLLRRGFCCFRG